MDVNCLRDEAIVSKAIRNAENGCQILLPDTTGVELTKSPQWYDTFTYTLRLLTKHPDCCFISRATGELIREEKKTGEAYIDVIDHECTPAFRQLLREIDAGSGPHLEAFKSNTPLARKAVEEERLNAHANKGMLLRTKEMWNQLEDEGRKALRKGDEDLHRHLLAGSKMRSIIAEGLEQAGYTRNNARLLATTPSVSAHSWLCHAANALDWLAIGGIEGLSDDRFNNERCDMDYLLAATFCEELITKETKMQRLHLRLRRVIDLRCNDHDAIPLT
jgi:hypothetical protein